MAEALAGTHTRRRAVERWGARAAVLSAFAFAVIVPSRTAWAADEEELELAHGQYDASQYASAAARFERLLDPASPLCPKTPDLTANGCRLSDPAIIQRARGYYASCLVALDKTTEAGKEFEIILKENPTFTPSPAIFSKRAIEIFLKARERMESDIAAQAVAAQKKRQAAIEAQKNYDAWVDDMANLAATETVIEPRSRWIAAVPFGVGQFYNDDIGLGVLFLSVEALAAGTSIVTGVIHQQLSGDANVPNVAADQFDEIFALQVANNISIGTLAVAMVAGLIEAEVDFVEETPSTRQRKVRPRPPKPEVEVKVMAGPAPLGAGIEIKF